MTAGAPTRAALDTPPLNARVAHCPSRIQMEAVECGAAALAMVLSYFGRDVALAELRVRLGVSRNGSSAAAIVRGARSYGLDGQGVSVNAEGVKKLPAPAIVFWHHNHFLVVEGYRRGRWLLNDPARGRVRLTDREFGESFSGVALTFHRTDAFVERRTTFRTYLRALLRPLAGSRGAIAYAIIVGLARVVPTIVTSFLAGVFVAQILAARNATLLTGLLIILAGMAATQTLLAFLERSVFFRLETKLAVKLESGFLWHLLRLPVTFFAERTPGQLASRVSLNRDVANLLSGNVATTLLSFMTAVIYGVVLFVLQPLLAGVMVALAAGEVLLLKMTARVRTTRAQASMQLRTAFAGTSVQGLTRLEAIKARGGEDEFFATWSRAQTALLDSTQRFAVPSSLMESARSLLKMCEQLAVFVLGGLLVLDGRMTVAALVTFQGLARQFLAPVVQLSRIAGTLQTSRAMIDQLEDVLEATVDPQTQAAPVRPPARQLRGELEFRGVSFGFDAHQPPLVRDLSFHIPPGRRLAVVGRTGCGKSIVANLAAGLYAPWKGEIRLDGLPRADLPRAVVNASVAKVDQDIVLFEGSVRENLRLWDDTISEDQLAAAAQDAGIHDDIVAMPGGYDARIAEGGRNLSGGQAQRIEIARALAGNPTLLILDEATSALDADTEAHVDVALRRRGVSCLVIAHRISTIRDADEIIVLTDGRVAQRGTHAELAAAGGEYLALVSSA